MPKSGSSGGWKSGFLSDNKTKTGKVVKSGLETLQSQSKSVSFTPSGADEVSVPSKISAVSGEPSAVTEADAFGRAMPSPLPTTAPAPSSSALRSVPVNRAFTGCIIEKGFS
jgi:hypothetical protein